MKQRNARDAKSNAKRATPFTGAGATPFTGAAAIGKNRSRMPADMVGTALFTDPPVEDPDTAAKHSPPLQSPVGVDAEPVEHAGGKTTLMVPPTPKRLFDEENTTEIS